MKKDTTFTLILCLYGALLIVVAYFGVRFVADYFKNKQSITESEFEFVLKAKPEDVIFSQAYKDEQGRNNIKYAYLGSEVLTVEGEDIARRTPDSRTFVLEQFADEGGRPMEKLKTIFTTSPQYYKDDTGWRQIEYATTTQETFSQSGAVKYVGKRELTERIVRGFFGIETVFAVTSTFYPDPDAEISSVDGHISDTITGQPDETSAWDTVQTNPNGTAVVDSLTTLSVRTSTNYIFRADTWGATLIRAFFLFDTSSLSSAAVISSATLSVYVTGITNGYNFGNDTLCVITTTPASNTGLVGADYDQIGTILQASAVDISGIATSAYTNFSLNSTGLSNISKTGVTKFGIRMGEDLNNTSPSDANNLVIMSAAENTGTSQDPKLEVTYTTPSNFSMGQWFPF